MKTVFKGEVIYTAEVDAHFPQLSVGDTLYFAAMARSPRHIPGGESRERYAEHLRDVRPPQCYSPVQNADLCCRWSWLCLASAIPSTPRSETISFEESAVVSVKESRSPRRYSAMRHCSAGITQHEAWILPMRLSSAGRCVRNVMCLEPQLVLQYIKHLRRHTM